MSIAPSLGMEAALPTRRHTIEVQGSRVRSKLAELWQYRELFYFFVWRDVKVRYAQSILGVGWAIVQPLVPMIIFTAVFGRLAKISSDGIPYAIFSYAALVPWTYFANALHDASGSVVKEVDMLSKIYFPRMIIPLTPVFGRLIDLAIAFLLLFVLMAWYQMTPTLWILLLPWLVFVAGATAAGLGMWLSALAVQYRDVKHAMTFTIQLLMYAAPVVYPASLIPSPVRHVYAVNPMVGVIEGFRACVLGATPVPWDLILIGSASAVCILSAGTLCFIRKESVFADVA